ncbi:hypothetical protein D9M70_542110 [compost metagenome]
MIVVLDRGLTFLGAAHHRLADHDIGRAEHEKDEREAHVHGKGGRNEQHQRDGRSQVLAHEFEPETE